MPKGKDESKQRTGNYFPVEQAPWRAPLRYGAPHKRICFGHTIGQHVVGKESVKDLEQNVKDKMRPNGSKRSSHKINLSWRSSVSRRCPARYEHRALGLCRRL